MLIAQLYLQQLHLLVGVAVVDVGDGVVHVLVLGPQMSGLDLLDGHLSDHEDGGGDDVVVAPHSLEKVVAPHFLGNVVATHSLESGHQLVVLPLLHQFQCLILILLLPSLLSLLSPSPPQQRFNRWPRLLGFRRFSAF